jgi:hypothetical protein
LYHVVCYVVNWSNVVANPVIYMWTQRRYRKAVVNLLGCGRGRRRQRAADIARASVALNNRRGSHMRSSISE